MVHGLESSEGRLLLGLHHVDGEELLNLSLLLVEVHNDGLVVGLADAVNEGVVLRHQDAVDGADGVGHVVEELAPHPVAVFAYRVNEPVGVLGWRKIARLGCTAHIN